MRIGKKLLCFCSCLFTVTLSGCSCSFKNIFDTRLKSIEIVDYNKAYVLGDVYQNENALSIVGTYTDGSTKNLSYDDMVVYSAYVDAGGSHVYNPADPFTATGEYSLQVTYDNVTSNSIKITVLTEHIYATDLMVDGSQDTIEVWKDYQYPCYISPSECTAPLKFSASDPSLVKLTRCANGMNVYGVSGGELDIVISVASSKTTYITRGFHIKIESKIVANKMSKTYNDVIKNNYYRFSGCPLNGNVKLLVIPVWFSDSTKYIASTNKEYVREDINKAYFGSTTDTGWQSVSSYYKTESDGALILNGTVSEWYDSNIDTKTAGAYNSSQMKTFVKKATDWYFDNHSSDSRSNYDFDNDGYLDGVMLIYGAPDHQTADALKNYSNLWAYCFWIQETTTSSKIIPNVFFWASYDFMYGANTVIPRTGLSYHAGDTTHCNIDAHTYIHEMGHVLGLDDYYDYGGNKYDPCGGFSMQDCNVGGHDPFSTLSLGWGKAYIPTESMDITLRSFQDSHQMVLLTPEWNGVNSPFDEYLLLELYTTSGLNRFDSQYQYCNRYPQGASKVGIRLWHVDARLFRRSDQTLRFYNDPSVGQVVVSFTNTYYKNPEDIEYMTELYETDHRYGELNLLQLIRNDELATYHPTDRLSNSSLFYAGDNFSMSDYSLQFYNGARLNNGKSLPWSFEVKEISTNASGEYYANISLTRS